MAERVRIVEVAPRDGLQNEAAPLPPATRAAFIEKLAAAGLTSIEAGSFVSPKWVPQMADTAAVLKALGHRAGVSFPVLVPNIKGLDAALAAGAKRDRHLRRRLGDVLAQEHQLLHRRVFRTLRSGGRARVRRWLARAGLCLLRARLPL